MAKANTSSDGKRTRRRYTKEFREEAVQMMLDGHSASSVAERTGSNRNAVYKLIYDARSKLRIGPKPADYSSGGSFRGT